MKYCVIKDTTRIIDGSENPIETMLLNAINAGFEESEVEILTEEEYLARKELEPIESQPKSELEILKEENETLKKKLDEHSLAMLTLTLKNL
ncbi:hypothetical protein [Proteiniborus sp. MB09-C3]|uniref:hypothetical protein n=1 Tax=Proteiniborus sp. MB09-C3 TaxID=3050072 RepID=UPI0025573563|nr:hypothetical protein [Proteiniborus sp. MB09-C3]WIV10551.1 hypothetical protein QO263_10305 [Proteiniborus sp. MB09-C3]